ncbi:hypothetical protein GCM10008101_27990 [Lysobacter xinjiangensis]|uniref:GGDEF domain-containing protein n=1 Tax=Cognatilysobacter xinjiangensis TaxID=546892 RepID=A0ABQ3C7V2_9GAMM|nr:hypothetical protein [Lysobacter xinjiangensis]GGZ72134.1 hypothetical protein GCM10008101_27990 [Lysobacter xinjiangensis]
MKEPNVPPEQSLRRRLAPRQGAALDLLLFLNLLGFGTMLLLIAAIVLRASRPIDPALQEAIVAGCAVGGLLLLAGVRLGRLCLR